MEFDKAYYKQEFERLIKVNSQNKFFIKESNASFKISKFVRKALIN
jgi:hypothetical protein